MSRSWSVPSTHKSSVLQSNGDRDRHHGITNCHSKKLTMHTDFFSKKISEVSCYKDMGRNQ